MERNGPETQRRVWNWRHEKTHSPPPWVVKIVGLILAVGIGFILSWVAARYYAGGAFVNWIYLGTPPAPLQSFQSAMFDESVSQASVIIETNNEMFYRGSQSLCELANNCWEKVDFIPENIPSGQFHVSKTCTSSYGRMGDPPGEIVSCATYEDLAAGTHFIRNAHFAVLDDGTIWTWQFVPGAGALLIILAGVAISILVAVALLGSPVRLSPTSRWVNRSEKNLTSRKD